MVPLKANSPVLALYAGLVPVESAATVASSWDPPAGALATAMLMPESTVAAVAPRTALRLPLTSRATA